MSAGAGAIKQVVDEVKKRGAKVVLCQIEPAVADIPERYGLTAEIDGTYDFVEEVIEAYKKRDTTSAPS